MLPCDLGYVNVVASEGLVDKNGDYIFAAKGRDAFGHIMLGGLAETLNNITSKPHGAG